MKQAKIGMIGFPVEAKSWRLDVENMDFGLDDFLIPEKTNRVREHIKEKHPDITDLGEYDFGYDFSDIHYRQMPNILYQSWLRQYKTITNEQVWEARDHVLNVKKDFDKFLCIAPSHILGVTLYEDDDFVARLDAHGDYFPLSDREKEDNPIGLSHARYMNHVEQKFPHATIYNYGVLDFKKIAEEEGRELVGGDMTYYGELKNISEIDFPFNHIDIDMDAFESKNGFTRSHFYSDLEPEQLFELVTLSNPSKIGLYEFSTMWGTSVLKFADLLITTWKEADN